MGRRRQSARLRKAAWRRCRFRAPESARPAESGTLKILLQRVRRDVGVDQGAGVVLARGVVAASLCKGEVLEAPAVQQAREALVAFNAARLGVEPVLLVAL